MGAIARLLTHINETSRDATGAIAKRTYALDAAVDGALDRSTALLDRVRAQTDAHLGEIESRLEAARALVETIGVEGVRSISQRLDVLVGGAQKLKTLFAGHEEASAGLPEQFADAAGQIETRLRAMDEAGAATVGALNASFGRIHGGLAELRLPLEAGRTAIATLAEQVDQLRRASDEVAGGLEARLPATVERIDALGRGAGELGAQAEALLSALGQADGAARDVGQRVAQARQETAALGTHDAQRIAERFDALDARIGEIGERFGGLENHGTRSFGVLGETIDSMPIRIAEAGRAHDGLLTAAGEALHDHTASAEQRLMDMARSGETLGSRMRDRMAAEIERIETDLAAMRASAEEGLGALTEAIRGAHAQAERLGEPIAGSHATAERVHARLTDARIELRELGTDLAAHLPAAAIRLGEMEAAAHSLGDRVDALTSTARDGGQAIGAVSDRLAKEANALHAATSVLSDNYRQAASMFTELGERAGVSRDEQARAFADLFARLQGSAAETVETMRKSLAHVIEEAETALDRAGSERAEVAFGAPIRLQIAAVEAATERASAATQAAAERIAGQLRRVSDHLEAVQAHADEIDTHMDVRVRDSLSAQSSRLIEHLQAAAIDVGKLMAVDADGRAWVRYLKGDKGVFARRLVATFDADTRRRIARHYTHDGAFSDEANRYMDFFERLMRRVLRDPEGDAIASTMVTSDLGKLYVALARGAGRWEPMA